MSLFSCPNCGEYVLPAMFGNHTCKTDFQSLWFEDMNFPSEEIEALHRTNTDASFVLDDTGETEHLNNFSCTNDPTKSQDIYVSHQNIRLLQERNENYFSVSSSRIPQYQEQRQLHTTFSPSINFHENNSIATSCAQTQIFSSLNHPAETDTDSCKTTWTETSYFNPADDPLGVPGTSPEFLSMNCPNDEFPETAFGEDKKMPYEQTHKGVQISCPVCGQTLSSNWHLNRHMANHADYKKHECKMCKKAFRQKCLLLRHMRTHTGEKPFTCEICKNAFSLKCKLLEHMRTHTGEKPFKCEICGKSFALKCNLKVHQLIHTGERPYKCEKCGKSFKRKNSIQYHFKHACPWNKCKKG